MNGRPRAKRTCGAPSRLVIEMQSEGGAAGAVHGALQTGALTTTFTASQGLLLMIPNMYKIAGELTSTVFHVAARSMAAQALSIFGDHSGRDGRPPDRLRACSPPTRCRKRTIWPLIAQAATLQVARARSCTSSTASAPRTKSAKIDPADRRRTARHDRRRPGPRRTARAAFRPIIRSCAAPPRTRMCTSRRARRSTRSTRPYPAIVQEAMDKFAQITGRQYHLFDYVGAPDAERVVIVVMGSGGETAADDRRGCSPQRVRRSGVLKVRLYRPFSLEHFVEALPATVKSIAVLDRTKEPGAAGEPLYLDW